MTDLSNKTALCVDNGLFCSLAVRLGQDFGKVYYCNPSWVDAFPKMNKAMIGHGFDEIEVVDDIYGDHFEEIDIFIFPDVYFGELQLALEMQGKLVWGARMGEELELHRDATKELMKELKLPVGPWNKINGFAKLREFLKENKNQFVKVNKWRGVLETFHSPDYRSVEPKLDEVEYGLGAFKDTIDFIVEESLDDKVEIGVDAYTIDGKFPKRLLSGIEVKDTAYVGIFKEYDSLPKVLTGFDKALTPTLAQYGYRGFYSSEIRVGKDHVPYMIDFCFDDQTEVLSERGWIAFNECVVTDRLATLNVSNAAIEYQQPTRLIAHQYDGEMVRITNPRRTIDCVVTPDHAVLRTDRHKKIIFKQPAVALDDKGFIPRTGAWKSSLCSTHFLLPEFHHKWEFVGHYGHRICTREKLEPATPIDMKDWAAFLAWYLSEGSTSSVSQGRTGIRYVTQISQTKHPEAVRKVLKRLPFKFSYNGKMFRISSAQLATHLYQFGLCGDKFVPDYIKQSSREIIRVFLDNYCLGDGSERRGQKSYNTSSKRMADDLQELIFKVGSVANISRIAAKGTEMRINGKRYIRNYDKFVLHEATTNHDFWFETQARKSKYITKVRYSGMVYCATVPNGTLYVRRNGKPFWSGNCARAGSPPSELYQEFYKNISQIIWDGANGVCTDPIPESKYGAELLIHSSWADRNWQPVDFPDDISRFVKLRNMTKIKDRVYVIPQAVGLPEIGSVIGWGDTLDKAIEMCIDVAGKVEGYYIITHRDSFNQAQDEIEKLDKFGIKLF